MHLSHKIKLDPNQKQREYFAKASGTHRFVWNWALAEWNRQYSLGQKPTGYKLRKQFNSIYKAEFPWVMELHRDCHSQPFIDLQTAFNNFFKGNAEKPTFKKKGRDRAGFYIANDKFSLNNYSVRFPRLGNVRTFENLRFDGKIMCARVVEEAGDWFACISVDVGEYKRESNGNGVVGVDLGISTLATLSTGEKLENLKPLRNAQRRLKRAQRKLSRRTKGSNNRKKQIRVVAKIHRRIRNIRHNHMHKLTSKLCKNHAVVVIEDLAPSNMVKNHCLAQSISDASFGLFRRIMDYKTKIYGTTLVVAGRFYPSSKTCSSCGKVKDSLSLGERVFQCEFCGIQLDRDHNASLNLANLGAVSPEVTLAETSQ